MVRTRCEKSGETRVEESVASAGEWDKNRKTVEKVEGLCCIQDMSEDDVGQAEEEEDLCLYIFFMLIFSKLTKYFVQPF